MKLISLLPLNLREAEGDEKEEAPAGDEGSEENPFAAAAGGEGEDAAEGGEEAAGGDAAPADEEGDDKSATQKPLEVTFDLNRARKYNDSKIKDNKGVVTGISRFGITVTLPDETNIFVNFEDIQ